MDIRLADGRVDSDVKFASPVCPDHAALSHPRFHALERFSLTTYSVECETQSLLSWKAKALVPLAKARGIIHPFQC
jgi:hypothetical protein